LIPSSAITVPVWRSLSFYGLLLSALAGLSGCATTLTPGQKVLYGDDVPPIRTTQRAVRKPLSTDLNVTRLSLASRASSVDEVATPTDTPFLVEPVVTKPVATGPLASGPLVLGQSPVGFSGDGPDLGGGLTSDPATAGVDRWVRNRTVSAADTGSQLPETREPDGRFEPARVFGTHSSVWSEEGGEHCGSGPHHTGAESDPEFVWADTIWERHVDLGQRLWTDQKNFYDVDTLGPFAIAIGGAAILANSGVDREFAEDYQENIFNDDTDKASSWVKWMGDGRYTLPILGVATALSIYVPEDEVWGPVGIWGQRGLRATITGALPLWVLQRAIGSGRPGLDENNSSWAFWDHSNGVSGHTFISAVPFITAARMVENPWAKAGLYFGSTLTGLSRINDHDHYLSQVLLGWFLAYLAVDSVFDTDTQAVGWHLVSIPPQHGQGVGLELRY
jgi:hypothetical protein